MSRLGQVLRSAGESMDVVGVAIVGADGELAATYQLAGVPGVPLASLAAGAATATITIPAGGSGSYGWSYVFGGTTPSLKLQALGADGGTWQDIGVVTASGSQGIVIFTGSGGAQVRLLNAGANPITNLSSQLSS